MNELSLITEFYGERRAERSGVPLINHIHEGLTVLDRIGATASTMRAYCLHPLFQADKDLAASSLRAMTEHLDPWVMVLVMEYRNQANAWLSDRVFTDVDDRTGKEVVMHAFRPTVGPLPEVRDMLIADKVQNYKDFRTYHQRKHPRSKELTHYFKTWLKELGIDKSMFDNLCEVIDNAKRTQP